MRTGHGLAMALLFAHAIAAQGRESAQSIPPADWSGTWRPEAGMPADPATFGLEASQDPGVLQLAAAGREKREMLLRSGTFTTAASRCLYKGLPLEMTTTAIHYEFLIARDRVTVIAENGFVRRIFTDGRGHPADYEPTFAGHSVGHWEGDVLLVDTIGLGRSELGPYVVTENTTRVAERIRRLDADHLQDEFTVIDPTALARPWHFTRRYVRVAEPMGEYVCNQNNRDNGRDVINLTPPPD